MSRWHRLPPVALALGFVLAMAPRAATAESKPPRDTVEAPPALRPPVNDRMVLSHVLLDELEYRGFGPGGGVRWDGQAWMGTDWNRLWLKSEGLAESGRVSDVDVEAFYDRPIPRMRYFDWQAGMRQDLGSGPARTWAAVGIEGLLPNFYAFEPTLYFRGGGNIAARVNGLYNLLITNRLILQPQMEINLYNKDDPARGTGSGLSDLDGGIRLRYGFSRKFAPYIGFGYSKRFGHAADFARLAGEAVSQPRFEIGLRIWY